MSKNKRNKNRRDQTPKNPLAGSRNFAMVEADLARRSSSAGMPHRSNKDYRRKPKHVNKGWD